MSGNRVNYAGLVQMLLDLGLTFPDSLSEIIDNSFDAGAKNIKITITNGADGYWLYIADDGCGMNKNTFNKYELCDRKLKTEKNGFAGIGGPAAEAVLTNEEGISFTLTKMENFDVVEAVVDFPDIIQKNTWNPVPNDMSVKRQSVWTDYSINKNHGTVVGIKLSSSGISYFEDENNRNDFISDTGRTYSDYIESGCNLSFQYINEVNEIKSNPCLPNVADNIAKANTVVEIWKETNGSDIKCYAQDPKKKTMVRVNEVRKQLIKAMDYKKKGVAGYEKIAEITLSFAYNCETEKNGKIYFKRNQKVVAAFPNNIANSGDFARQDVIRGSNYCVSYVHNADFLFRTEVNKSRLNENNVNSILMKTIRLLTTKFVDAYYDAKKPRSEIETNTVVSDYDGSVVGDVSYQVVSEPVVEVVQPIVSDPVVEVVQQIVSEPLVEAVQTILSDPVVQVVQSVVAEPVVENATVIPISASVRTTPKSLKDLHISVSKFVKSFNEKNINIENYSNIAESGVAELVRTLTIISTKLGL